MTRWSVRLMALVAIALATLVMGAGVAQAAELDRSRVGPAKLAKSPYSGTALITVGNRVVCTGFIIAPRKVVTAAHCLVRDPAQRNFKFRHDLPGSVRIYRAYSHSAGGARNGVCRAAKVWAHANFIKKNSADRKYGSRAHDYAVITTQKGCTYPQSAIVKMWANEAGYRKVAPGKVTRMAGYPADPRYPGMNGLNMWRTEGRIGRSSDPRMLVTTGLVAQGMSGAPVWRSFGSASPCGARQCIVGIITECQVNAKGLCRRGDSPRMAVRITPAVKKNIKTH